jgi:hypothetical protein
MKKRSPATKFVGTKGSMGFGSNHRNKNLPPIKTKIILNKRASSSPKRETTTKETETARLPSTLKETETARPQSTPKETETARPPSTPKETETARPPSTSIAQSAPPADNAKPEKLNETDKSESLITQELSVRVKSFQQPTLADDVSTSSPTTIVAFSPEKKPALFSQDSKDDDDDDDIGLEKNTFYDLMKVIDDNDNDDLNAANNSDKNMSIFPPASTAATSSKTTSVEHLQASLL